jgi:hypothetical protein
VIVSLLRAPFTCAVPVSIDSSLVTILGLPPKDPEDDDDEDEENDEDEGEEEPAVVREPDE